MKLYTRAFPMERYIVLNMGPGKVFDRLEYLYSLEDKEWFQEETSEPDEGESFDITPLIKRAALRNLLEKGIKK